MKISRCLVNTCILLFLGLLLVGCRLNNKSSSSVSLDFLITPEQLRIHSNSQLKELNEVEAKVMANIGYMKEKYDDISNISEEDLEIQDKLMKQFMDVVDSGIIIKDKIMIENIFKQLRRLEGVYTDSLEGEVIAKIELIEDPKTQSVVSLDNAYLREFIILDDGNMAIPKGVMVKSTSGLEATGRIEYIKVKLTENLKYELEKLAMD